MSEREYRKTALSHFDEECVGCGDREDVVIHHKDGDKSNNELSNLIPLCRGCHQKVHGGSGEFADLVRKLGKRPKQSGRTTISLTKVVADELHERKERGDSYEDVIWRLIEDDE